jgi:hypothetical protein
MEISHQQLDEILADFSAQGRTTYLDDPVLDIGHTATERDGEGVPQFSPDLPRVPVVLIERHQALWTTPADGTPRQEVWTENALSQGMRRISVGQGGARKLPNLDGWLIAPWPREGGGLQLQQPDGALFVYATGDPDPTWIAAAQHYQWVLVLHGPRLGLRDSSGQQNTLDGDASQTELAAASADGLVTGGLMRWGQVRPD